MREIDLGKRLADSPQPNIIKFIGCVTTERKELCFCLMLVFVYLFVNCYFGLVQCIYNFTLRSMEHERRAFFAKILN